MDAPKTEEAAPETAPTASGSVSSPQTSDGQYEAVEALLRQPPQRGRSAIILLGSLAVFVLAKQTESTTWIDVVSLLAVITFHELGHYAAMRAFGYRDVTMFFIPFLGAAVSGRKASVEAWKSGTVLLAGPLPGIVLGLVLAATMPQDAAPWLRHGVLLLLIINGFNLLPLAAFDGGKVLQLTLFARHLWLEVGFLTLAAGSTLVWAISIDSRVLMFIAAIGLSGLPMRYRLLRAAQRLREEGIALPREYHVLASGAPAISRCFDSFRFTP